MKKILLLLLVVVVVSCESNNKEEDNVDWLKLKEAIINQDNDLAKPEFLKLLANTTPDPTSDDPTGQKENIDKLIQAINASNVLTAELFCYNCILTYPGQSEITVEVDSSGTSISKIVDILTPEDDILSFRDIHEVY